MILLQPSMSMEAFKHYFGSIRSATTAKYDFSGHCDLVVTAKEQLEQFKALVDLYHFDLSGDSDKSEDLLFSTMYNCTYFSPGGLLYIFEKNLFGTKAHRNRCAQACHPVMHELFEQMGCIITDSGNPQSRGADVLKTVVEDLKSLTSFVAVNHPYLLTLLDKYGKYPYQRMGQTTDDEIRDIASRPAKIDALQEDIDALEQRNQNHLLNINESRKASLLDPNWHGYIVFLELEIDEYIARVQRMILANTIKIEETRQDLQVLVN